MPNCCVLGCKVRGGHRFPKNSDLKSKWVKAVNIAREDWEPNKDSIICRFHFEPNAYVQEGFRSGLKLRRKILKPDSVPTIFPPVVHEPKIRFAISEKGSDSTNGSGRVIPPPVFGFVDINRVGPPEAGLHPDFDPLHLSGALVKSEAPDDVKRLPDDVKRLPDDVKRLPDDVKRLPDDMKPAPPADLGEPRGLVKREMPEDVKREPPEMQYFPHSPLRTDTGKTLAG